MEHWQFLIQKQGDRSWYALESPNLEILEGQYRVLARSHLPNIDVEVRVIHSSKEEVPPKRRIFKRSRRTNSEGLMAVIPFTYFKPGVWELRCYGDLMSDLLGKSWQYSVKLRVVPQKLDEETGKTTEEENLESNSTDSHNQFISTAPLESSSPIHPQVATTNLTPETTEEDIVSDQPVSPVWLKGETAEQILQNLIELALPSTEPLRSPQTIQESPATQQPSPLILSLDREIYVARWGQLLKINGQVGLKEKTNLDQVEKTYLKNLHKLELGIELRSPLESKLLTQVRQPLPNQVLPFTISAAINIPADCKSKLILGEISLYGELADVRKVIRLASQSFTITADVKELLAITATASSTLALLDDSSIQSSSAITKVQQTPVSLDLALFNLVKTPKTDQSLVLTPSPNKPLPPRIQPKVLPEANLGSSTLNNLTSENSPQLPKLPPLPPVPTNASALDENFAENLAIASDTSDAEILIQEEPVEKNKPMAAINLEQLLIRHRRVPKLEPTFPYLRRVKALPAHQEKVKKNTPESLEFQASVNLPPLNTTVVKDDSVAVPKAPALPNPKLSDEFVTEEVTQVSTELSDQSNIETVAPASAELMSVDNSPSSPLIQKWMHSKGYSLVEPINEQYQNYNPSVPGNQRLLSGTSDTANANINNLPLIPDTVEKVKPNEEFVVDEEIDTQIYTEAEIIPEETLAPPPPLAQAPLPPPVKTSLAWLAQEIVVDDTYSEPETDTTSSQPWQHEEQPLSSLLRSLPTNGEIIEPLPIPQLRVPEGELIAGKFVTVRVELPEVSPQVVVKLWVEDYQTRWLLDGPHLLTNLLPNTLGGLEAITQLKIPFGCLEIRIEAIAFDKITQQESHKVTIVRPVIPPDLPKLQPDDLVYDSGWG